jgi:hypothetical protein
MIGAFTLPFSEYKSIGLAPAFTRIIIAVDRSDSIKKLAAEIQPTAELHQIVVALVRSSTVKPLCKITPTLQIPMPVTTYPTIHVAPPCPIYVI